MNTKLSFLVALSVLLFTAFPAHAQKGGKKGGGGDKSKTWVVFRDAPGDAVQSDATLLGLPGPYVDREDGVIAFMELTDRKNTPNSLLSTTNGGAAIRTVWLQGPDCSDESCLNPFPNGGGFVKLTSCNVVYPVAPGVGETVPAGVYLNFVIAEYDDTTERIYVSLPIDSLVPPLVTGFDHDADGTVDTLRVEVSEDSAPKYVRLQISSSVKGGVEYETTELGWASVPFACEFSTRSLP